MPAITDRLADRPLRGVIMQKYRKIKEVKKNGGISNNSRPEKMYTKIVKNQNHLSQSLWLIRWEKNKYHKWTKNIIILVSLGSHSKAPAHQAYKRCLLLLSHVSGLTICSIESLTQLSWPAWSKKLFWFGDWPVSNLTASNSCWRVTKIKRAIVRNFQTSINC